MNIERKFERIAKAEAKKEEKEEMSNQIYKLKKQVESFKDELEHVKFNKNEAEKNSGMLGYLYDQNLLVKKINWSKKLFKSINQSCEE